MGMETYMMDENTLQSHLEHMVHQSLKEMRMDEAQANQQRLMQVAAMQQAQYNPFGSAGISTGGGGGYLGQASSGWVTSAGVASSPYNGITDQYLQSKLDMSRLYPTVEPPRRKNTGPKFFRLHKEVQLEEGGEYEEPLDFLRIKVSRWLDRSGERMPKFAF
jgi:hypothetical protein